MGEGALVAGREVSGSVSQTVKSVTEKVCLEKPTTIFLKGFPTLKWRETMAEDTYS